MSTFDNAVSINPYFEIEDANMDAAKNFLTQFCELVKNEDKCLFYNFTMNGNIICCREAYTDAAGFQAHIENCGEALGKFMEIANLVRIEAHGPAGELEKIKDALAPMNPDYFVLECGIGK